MLYADPWFAHRTDALQSTGSPPSRCFIGNSRELSAFPAVGWALSQRVHIASPVSIFVREVGHCSITRDEGDVIVVTATLSEVKSLRPELEKYLEGFAPCIKTTPSQRHLATFVAGQVGPVERKTAEGIALAAGVAPRTLQQFLGEHRWDEDALMRALRARVQERHAGPEGILIVDETGCPKSGDHTVAVQRQYCGRTGKVDNCVMTVGLAYVHREFYCLLDTELYLPEESWANDAERRLTAGVPKSVTYRAKWEIACELVERARAEGVGFRWLTGDEAYGRPGPFRKRIAATGALYVLEIPRALQGWTVRPDTTEEGRNGRPLKHPKLAPDERTARRVDDLWERGGPSWVHYRVKDTTKGPQIWNVRETRFHPQEDEAPGPEERLIIAKNVLTNEVKYFLSNALDTPLDTLLYVAFTRWYVEKTFQESKGRVGLDHFEVRTYTAVKRHLILSCVSLLYLVEQALRLKTKASWWTVPQVREAIELQLDDEMSGRERDRQLKKLLFKINYYHKRIPAAADVHDDTQRTKLHDLGIDLRRVTRCQAPWQNLAEYN